MPLVFDEFSSNARAGFRASVAPREVRFRVTLQLSVAFQRTHSGGDDVRFPVTLCPLDYAFPGNGDELTL